MASTVSLTTTVEGDLDPYLSQELALTASDFESEIAMQGNFKVFVESSARQVGKSRLIVKVLTDYLVSVCQELGVNITVSTHTSPHLWFRCLLCTLCCTPAQVPMLVRLTDEMIKKQQQVRSLAAATFLRMVHVMLQRRGECFKFMMVTRLVSKLVQTKDIEDILVSLSQSKTAVPNSKLGKFNSLLYHCRGNEARVWPRCEFNLQLSLLAVRVTEGRFDLFREIDELDDVQMVIGFRKNPRNIESFSWRNHNGLIIRTRLEEDTFIYSGNINQLKGLFLEVSYDDLDLELIGFGQLPLFSEAVECARRFDKAGVPGTTSLEVDEGVAQRIRAGETLLFDEFRDHSYRGWAIWIIHVLCHSDKGRRYGNLLWVNQNIQRHWEEDGTEPLAQNHVYHDLQTRLKSMRKCPGCRSFMCTLFRPSGAKELIDYSELSEQEQAERPENATLGMSLRYRMYGKYAKRYSMTSRKPLPECVTYIVKLQYPGGDLTGFVEAPEEEDDEYGYVQ